jgi:gas vesicle protein
MKTTNSFTYICAGLGVGGLLGVLLAPQSGHRTRRRLRAAAVAGKDQVKAQAHSVSEAFEHRDEIFQAGKQRLSDAWEEGRSAYRAAAAQPPAPPASLLGSIGLVALGAVALTTGFKLTRGMGSGMTNLGQKIEDFLDASHAAVRQGSTQISAVASKTNDLLGAFENAVKRGTRRL